MNSTGETQQLPAVQHQARARVAARRGTSWRGIAIIAVAAFVAEMAVSARYGYVRDELYFLSAGRHLAFGYVDQPPLTPLLARLAAVAGTTRSATRVFAPATAASRASSGVSGGWST